MFIYLIIYQEMYITATNYFELSVCFIATTPIRDSWYNPKLLSFREREREIEREM